MAASARMKNFAVHFEKIVYGGAAGLAVLIFLIPFLSTRDLSDSYIKLDEAKEKLIKRQHDPIVPPIPPPLADTLAKQWSVPPAPDPWVTDWTTEARPGLLKVKQVVAKNVVAHPEGKVARIVPGRDSKKLQVFLHVEGARGDIKFAAVKSAKLQRKVVASKPADGSEFADLKDFGADQEIQYDDFDVKPGLTYAYRLITEIEPLPGTEIPKDDPEPLKKVSKEIPLGKVIPWEYRVRIISAVGYDPTTGAAASLNGEVWSWDYASKKVVKHPKGNWKEQDTFGPKVGEQERYKIQQVEDGKVKVQDRATTDLIAETLTPRENARPVDLPPEVTFEQVAAAEAAPPEGGPSEADQKAAAKAKPEKEKDKEKEVEKAPPKKPVKKTKTDTKKKKPVIK